MSDFSFYFNIGFHHILNISAIDHILFLTTIAAIYILNDWKQVLVLVTAFTIGHSLTLALSVFNIIQFSSNWVEFLIPLTIIFTAIFNLFNKNVKPKTIRINYYFALIFGLIHGMGFANGLRVILVKTQHLAWPLFGFNIGLEAGQLIVILFILFFEFIFLKTFKTNRRDWIVFISAASLTLALQMAFERKPW